MGPEMTDRREFIKKSLYWMLAILGLGFLMPGLRILMPTGLRGKETVFIPVMAEEEVPRSGVRKAEVSYAAGGREMKARIFLVSSPEGITALSGVCTHLGCLVNYRRDKNEFICPCHGGRYDRSGKNIAGPPPAPLTRFPVAVEKGMVLVGVKV